MKPFLLFRGPVETQSGYGCHSRDLLRSLYEMNIFDIKIDSCNWGMTPMTALKDNEFHNWIKSNIITELKIQPDIYIQVTIPSEFQPLGKFNVGITAGIETTIAPLNWIEGCNKMDLVITTSKFSKDILCGTIYNNIIKVEKPVEVLFEGVDTNIFNDQYKDYNLNISEDFAFLFVGHWLKGNIGQDRKNVAMLIKCFAEAFKDEEDKPALVLKTSHGQFSNLNQQLLIKQIEFCVRDIKNPPPIYLLYGELTDEEMNDLYNHPKIKSMVTITKGEGFGRPLLEFSMTGKPIIASNWSGHIDFLNPDKSVLIGGKLEDVDDSVVDDFVIKGSKWFTANYDEFIQTLKIVKNQYNNIKRGSEELKIENRDKFSLDSMTEKFKTILYEYKLWDNRM
jgi:glycosyltransferase involved in cell wall biosynthesis